MSTSIFVLMMANFAYIGVLPFVFFRRDGRFNLKWWLTSSPFFISAVFVLLHYASLIEPWYPPPLAFAWEAVATVLAGVSLGLISYTLGTHDRRLALWHQENDVPQHIVTHGAYKRIRHPFYASFIATLLASAVLCASAEAIAVSLVGLLMLNFTAAREERHLLRSSFGAQYRDYVARSGRFIPSWRRAQS